MGQSTEVAESSDAVREGAAEEAEESARAGAAAIAVAAAAEERSPLFAFGSADGSGGSTGAETEITTESEMAQDENLLPLFVVPFLSNSITFMKFQYGEHRIYSIEIGDRSVIQIALAFVTPETDVSEPSCDAVSSCFVVLQHVFIREPPTVDLFASQTQPVLLPIATA
jgi:hypothetical protein